jgi:hypothetical protein
MYISSRRKQDAVVEPVKLIAQRLCANRMAPSRDIAKAALKKF